MLHFVFDIGNKFDVIMNSGNFGNELETMKYVNFLMLSTLND